MLEQSRQFKTHGVASEHAVIMWFMRQRGAHLRVALEVAATRTHPEVARQVGDGGVQYTGNLSLCVTCVRFSR